MDTPGDHCDDTRPIDRVGFRVSALFVILLTSLIGTLFPIITKRVKFLRKRVPGIVFEFGKFFGSGVILATAVVHLLDPAIQQIGLINTYEYGGCISNAWGEYPYPLGICTAAIFFTFVIDLVAVRLGRQYLEKHGISTDHQVKVEQGLNVLGGQSRAVDAECASAVTDAAGIEQPESSGTGVAGLPLERVTTSRAGSSITAPTTTSDRKEPDYWTDSSESTPAGAQILGVAILEFGILFHSVIIGLTLALAGTQEFTTLYIVIIFHQAFEGLGLGTRLAFLQLPPKWNWVPTVAALIYSAMTPLGMAIGLGAQGGLSMTSASASIAGGVLDSVSAGILLYAATVELMAHEFVFNPYYHTCSWKRLSFVITCFALGTGLMSLLGKWA